jgi:hypothetical protein
MTSTPAAAGPITGSDDSTPGTESAEVGTGRATGRPVGRSAGVAGRRSEGDAGKWSGRTVTVLLYSDDVDTRAAVRMAVGPRPAVDLPRLRWVECATAPAVISTVDQGGLDLLVLDGEAVPAGGIGLCKQLKDEIYQCPPILVLTGRPQDAWLATWSRADYAVPHPLDPVAVAEAVAALLRRRLG